MLPSEEGLCFLELLSQSFSTVRRKQRCLLKAVQKSIERVLHFLATAQQKAIKLDGPCYLCILDTFSMIEGMFSDARHITVGRRNA
jgi:hypothetical protein